MKDNTNKKNWKDYLCCLGDRKKESKGKDREENTEQIELENQQTITSKENRIEERKDWKDNNFEYGLCEECHQPNTEWEWCQFCNVKHFQEEFSNWTSGNQAVDEFIQKSQLEATKGEQVLEWIPYKQFANIKYLAKGGFGEVYKAEWSKGPVQYWSIKDNQWIRKGDEKFITNTDIWENFIALKSLNNSQSMTSEFLREVFYHSLFNKNSNDWIVKFYGISQNPETKNYLMVMEYIPDGDIRRYLQDNQLTFKDKLDQLNHIAEGLKAIHEQGLIHHDFHAGNILNKRYKHNNDCYITDLGLCRPVDKINDGKIYGVLPYVAPEVLWGKSYIQASDIYSFGIISYEILTGLPPYHNIPHDKNLSIKICQGLRPNIEELKIPQLLKDLIKQCWDADPLKRPTIDELWKNLDSWCWEINDDYSNYSTNDEKDAKFYQQYLAVEKYKKTLPYIASPKHKIHPSAVYTSRLLDADNLPEPQNSEELNKQFYSSEKYSQLLLKDSELLDLDFSEEQFSLQTYIEKKPK